MKELNGVVAAMHAPLREFAAVSRELLGDNAKALVLFGAITHDAFDPRREMARSVLVVERVDLGPLRHLAGRGGRLGKQRIAAPLIMTPAYVRASLDTFPLELIEIQQRRVLLFGDDPFADLTFDPVHVRLQCERELKTIALGMRQGLLASLGRERMAAPLERDVAEGLLRTLRGLLWLKDDRSPKPPLRLIDAAEALTERKLSGVRAALDEHADHGWIAFDQLYGDVEALGQVVNDW